MLDIGWPELLIILVIALLVIGPRDLPRAMHTVGRWVKRARAVTSEFQRHFDEMARESELQELREMKRNMSARGIREEIDKTIDPTGDMRREMDIKGKTALGDAKGASVKPGNGAPRSEADRGGKDEAPAGPQTAKEPGAAPDKPAPPSAVPGSAEPRQPERTAQ